MKKGMVLLTGFLLAFSIFLTGCGGTDNTRKENHSDGSAEVKNKKDNNTSDEYVEDGLLLKVGEWTKDKDYDTKVTLEKIATPKIKVDLGDLNMLIKDVKIFKRENVSDAEKEEFSGGKVPVTDPYYTIQVKYDLENTGKNAMNFNGFDYIITDQKQQIDVMTDNIGMNGAFTVQPEAVVEDEYIICKLKKDNVDGIKKVTLKTSPVYNSETYDEITESKTIEIEFK
ncbi:hypothetical protein O1N65_003006 [Listeria monocytogenes]|uniref:Lipoprotein n=1 Tax=Listeria monocytogenes TaxID=1639 RepID=A0A9P1WYI8_LISMN|nr:hypothetical protein [Listeria monocytogenes]EJN8575630.1 hypothetical protein [Salmonella enterica subsp. enterica serovar Anatum]EAA0233612.1 hypothetical protein [Listeria monocytogenes]EAA0249153.1 hypothetical protein [Listeria monocytogenes]EAA0252220.1 hypothetical protein [Listeria monocytogenes]EAA0264257.1 hypothetical protein [Listeria monocytogenes]